ncbi:tetraacyldisaccharide 4'-kinase [Acuticoccus mangrovi]|uniref:Tetraacyldisaccharide 4'-kinase n=1 Tax=Acuticoccus mangrovi TaxID=2796142 RepID=A0A934ITZ7_9HYPH|nr:tetraacyldisaccharide 4'-kinase [Acuticoccus mangrovi]
MKAPGFWWRTDAGLASRLLSPAGAMVGRVAARRMAEAARYRAPCPVICIGNPTVGGAGKTPVALAVAAALKAAGARPAFLTRGYGGRLAGPVVVVGEDAAAVGDEALILASAAPTVVARDRAAGGRLAATLGDVIVMDDGFQNPGLAKDFSVLVVDRAVGVGNARVTPAGPLRAPLAAHLARADALLVVDAGEGVAAPLAGLDGVPAYDARLVSSAPVPLAGVRVLAYAGIGRPQKFFAGLAALGAELVATAPFPDHHPYRDGEAEALVRAAVDGGLRLVTTRKDWVRLATGSDAAQRLAAASVIAEVHAELDPAFLARVLAVWQGDCDKEVAARR